MAEILLDAPVAYDPERWDELDWTPLQASGMDAEAVDRMLVNKSPGAWFELYGKIIDKKKQRVAPFANVLQDRVFEVMVWCLANEVPIRLILLKPRQKGCSTVSMAVLYWLMNMFDNFKSVVIGHEYSQTDNLWQIFRTYSTNDDYDWGFDRRVLDTVCQFGNGATMDKETAQDAEAGRSGTYHGCVATEAARWRDSGVANAEDIMNGLLNCIPYLPGTFVVQESTARGAAGPFYETWEDALDFEEYKRRFERGESMDGSYIRVFAGWYEFADSCDDLTDDQRAYVADSATPVERELIQKYNLEEGHIAWRRRTIRIECQRDETKFDREFPETSAHAFRASSPSRFNAVGLRMIKTEALQRKEEWGNLEYMGRTPKPTERNFGWHPAETLDPNARLIRIEQPLVGMRYIIAVDTMEGEPADDMGEDLDHHVALVIRQGYFDPDRGWRPPGVVARTVLNPKKAVNCRWDIDILEEQVWRLAQYYGDCMIVVESNKDRGIIRGLKHRGALQYQRQTDEERGDIRSPKKSGKLGFRTTGGEAENTRDWIIENLARHIREWDQTGWGVETDLRTQEEMVNFCVNQDGKAEALLGEHDDSVLALAIGLALVNHATPMTARAGRPRTPRDLRKLENTQNRPRGQYT